MRAILYWYAFLLGKALWLTLVPCALLIAGILAGALVIPTDFIQSTSVWAEANLLIVSVVTVLFIAVGVASWMSQEYLTKPHNAPLPSYYEKNAILAGFPIMLPFAGFALLADQAIAADEPYWFTITMAVALGGMLLGILLGHLLKWYVRPDWQQEHLEELKDEAADVLRAQAFLQTDIDTALKGRSYNEVHSLKSLCVRIGDLNEKQQGAYGELMNTMKGYGVDMSMGAAFSDKTSAELMAEQENVDDS